MNWKKLNNLDDLQRIKQDTSDTVYLIFKHSTRCSISSMALNRLERAWKNDSPIVPFYLDLIAFREVSSMIANSFGVPHESPQAIVVKNGKVLHDASHMNINAASILSLQ